MERSNFAVQALLVLSLFAFVSNTMGDGMNLDMLRLEFENRKMKTLPCYYDGSRCDLESQYCSTTTKTCETFLNKKDSDLANVDRCKDLLTKNVTELGKYDVCIYFLGSLDKNTIHIGGITMEQLRVRFEKRTSMQIPCIYNGQQCELDSQYCNKASKICEDLFPKEASQEQRVEKCRGILETNGSDPGPYDVCIYYFGKLKNEEGPGESSNSSLWIALGVLLAVLVVLVLVAVLGLCCLHSKKKLPWRQYEQPSGRDTAVAKGGPAAEDDNRKNDMRLEEAEQRE